VENLVGLTIAQALVLCGARYSDVQMVDEPPGKLRGVSLLCRQGLEARQLVLEFRYGDELFSADRSWPEALVQSQKIVAVRDSTRTTY
jgi:hypothetical protein